MSDRFDDEIADLLHSAPYYSRCAEHYHGCSHNTLYDGCYACIKRDIAARLRADAEEIARLLAAVESEAEAVGRVSKWLAAMVDAARDVTQETFDADDPRGASVLGLARVLATIEDKIAALPKEER
jgi:hypothetical protein